MLEILNFYAFTPLTDLPTLQAQLSERMKALELTGTILLASEGFNLMLGGTREALDTFYNDLHTYISFVPPHIKRAPSAYLPFRRSKVLIKKEIVTYKEALGDPTICVGQYIAPQQWNALITQPDVITIDTRNDYEYAFGHFEKAINPHTESFSEFAQFVETELNPQEHSKVAMYCTGGIRCEKATSHLLQLGFKEVYHLEGGILHYFEVVPPAESLWIGGCFVFDDRETVSHEEVYAFHQASAGAA